MYDQVVSLGTHIVDHRLAGAMLLMEIMPANMGRRSFPPPMTEEMNEPGFRDSPDPAHHMALVFTKAIFKISLDQDDLKSNLLTSRCAP